MVAAMPAVMAPVTRHVETFFARNLGDLIHARTGVPGRPGKAASCTSSNYVDEKSDEAIVLAKRLNKGR